MEIDKVLAANSQPDEAIRLFFERRDPISIHTLAFAAHQVLFDLSRAHRSSTLIVSGLKDSYGAPPELTKEWHRILKEPANFFKHADKDCSEKLDFDPEVTTAFLFDCTFMLEHLGHTISDEAAAFRLWFFLKYPDALMDGPIKARFTQLTADLVDPDDVDSFRRLLDEWKRLNDRR